MFGKKSDLKRIDEKKNQLVDHMDQVSMDSDEFELALKNYQRLVETENAIKDGKNKRSSERAGTGLKIGTLIVSAVAGIGIPIYLANMSYEHDQRLDMKNGSIWNLIGKKFDK